MDKQAINKELTELLGLPWHEIARTWFTGRTYDIRCACGFQCYGEWQKDRKGPLSYQDRLRLAIDTALAERPAGGTPIE